MKNYRLYIYKDGTLNKWGKYKAGNIEVYSSEVNINEFMLNDVTSEPFVYDTKDEYWQQEMEQDQIDWVISMSDYGRKELNFQVQCNNCDFEGYEEDLAIYNETSNVDNTTLEYFKSCPNCKTDKYLQNL